MDLKDHKLQVQFYSCKRQTFLYKEGDIVSAFNTFKVPDTHQCTGKPWGRQTKCQGWHSWSSWDPSAGNPSHIKIHSWVRTWAWERHRRPGWLCHGGGVAGWDRRWLWNGLFSCLPAKKVKRNWWLLDVGRKTYLGAVISVQWAERSLNNEEIKSHVQIK